MLFYQKPLTRRMYVCYTSYATGDDYMMKLPKGMYLECIQMKNKLT